MKKTNKLFVTVLSLALVSSAFIATGCNNKETVEETIQTSVKLSANAISLCVGDTTLLGANLSGGDASTNIEFKCLDESIATINEFGFVKALKPGTTEIRAIYGKAIAKCKVSVELRDNVPSIELKNILDKSIQIDKSTRFDIDPVINFNNALYDFEPTFKVDNESIAVMEGKTFVPKSNGVAHVTISGKFFGTQAVSTTLEVIIKDNVIIYMKNQKGVERSDVYLYSVGQVGDEVFETSFTPSEFGVILNGEKVESPNISVQFVDDEGVVTYNPSNYQITSTSNVGSAQYVVTYVDNESNSYVKTFNVYNNKSVFTYSGDVIETDSVGSELPVDEIFKDFASKEIIKATSLDGQIEYKVQDGKVLGLPVVRDSITGEVQDATYVVYNNTVGFKVRFRTYTKIVKTVEDLGYFTLKSLSDKFEGYYVLANDIDGLTGGSYYKVPAHERTMGNAFNYYPSVGMLGIFDGRGHTISHVSLGEGGLFGNLGNGAIIKNLGVENVDLRREAGKDDVAVLTTFMNGSTLDNVYISNNYISAGYNAGLVANNIMSNCSIKNSYFHLQMSDMSQIITKNYGVLGSICGERKNLGTNFKNVYKNVVINSNIPLIHSQTNTIEKVDGVNVAKPFICDVEGHNFTVEEGFDEFLLDSDVTRYYLDSEMSSSGNTFANYDKAYWHVESGMLCWGAM